MATLGRVRTTWAAGPVTGSLSTHYFGPNMNAPTTTEIQACVDRVRDFWTALNNHIQIGTTWTTEASVDAISDIDGQLVTSFPSTSRTGQGTLAGDPLPYQTQGLVKWLTSTVADGHRLRGHTYIPAPMESENTSGAPVAAYVTACGTAAAAMLAAGTYNLVIWHRPVFDSSGTIIRNGSSGLVTGGSGQPSWSVLRSRRS